MTTKKRSVLMAVLTLMLCVALVASGSYALFTEEAELTNHLQAGSLDITLTRTRLDRKTIDPETGLFVTPEPNTDTVDFSGPTDRNVFDFLTPPLIVPLCEYTATMQITNDPAKCDVPFGYWIQIIYDGQENLALGDQLQVDVTTEDGTVHTAPVNRHLTVGSESDPIGILAVGTSATFSVRVTFLDLENNNDAQGQSLEFDLIVHAVQIVTDEDTPSPDQ